MYTSYNKRNLVEIQDEFSNGYSIILISRLELPYRKMRPTLGVSRGVMICGHKNGIQHRIKIHSSTYLLFTFLSPYISSL